jgi:malate dehydrogenase
MPQRAKISIIGAGNVGATCAHWAAAKELGDIVLLDIPDKVGVMPRARPSTWVAAPRSSSSTARSSAPFDYKDIADSDVVVITAGLPRKPGMSRDDLIADQRQDRQERRPRTSSSTRRTRSSSSSATRSTRWCTPRGRPPASRPPHHGPGRRPRRRPLPTFLAMELGVSVEDIQALLLGGHGDDMVPLPRLTSVHGIPVSDLLPAEKIAACVERAKVGGGEIVKLMGTSAYYAPASGTIQMVEAIVKDKKRIIPCAAYCEKGSAVRRGKGLFVGVPASSGRRASRRSSSSN